ncbi:DUF3515 domain-containing protein [Streptomyces mangrovisoli]|uniref:DUF3515 domain-containing protein n=1 Tax=Streptomyces mangrovisoli TaxID=1428628 RepID=A0A1J4NXV6_9ACTN|nr:DUF3515 domain-containing protein [Streptomyces mangrovisoli]OIJ65958.1 hypothetical protein WN71_020980 [Streptomyces mangrovisoli]
MNFFRHRLVGLPVLALTVAAAGCSFSTDDTASVAVPRPGKAATALCQDLDQALPRKVDGLGRDDPEPRSALTAGWGGPAIILRCGVERPPKMVDPKVAEGGDADAIAGGVNGVDWLMEKQKDGSYRFTTANRRAYVQVTLEKARADESSSVLVDLAASIKKAIPEGIAD